MSFQDGLQADILKSLYDYWQKLRRGRRAPARADVDPAAIANLLPHLGLIDVERNPRRYRIRLMGTRIVSWYGCDLTDRYLDEFDSEASGNFKILDQVVDRIVPAHAGGVYTRPDARRIPYQRLFLPLSNDGLSVNMLLGAAIRLPASAPIVGGSLDV